jgi:hypothetical protein
MAVLTSLDRQMRKLFWQNNFFVYSLQGIFACLIILVFILDGKGLTTASLIRYLV